MFDGATAEPVGGDWHACIPLTSGGKTVGAILIGAPGNAGPTLDTLDERAVRAVRELVTAALVARGRAEQEQARMLKEAAELKFDVVSMLSHEMRTPLASIKGYASALLLDDVAWDAEAAREFIQAIETEADHLGKLIAEMLESAAIDAGELHLELEPVLMPHITKRVVDKIGIQTSNHRFVLLFAADFPAIEADGQRIEQVLTNLIDNAVKYSPDGGLVVVRGEQQTAEVVISVVDQGIGIAPEDLNKLFERFFRASPDRRRRIVGTGLGLPIAEAIVRAHGGRIWAESVVGSGTTLAFTLPHPRPAAQGVGA